MGKNKLKKFGEMETFPNVFQYPFAELQKGPFPLKGKWNTEFFKNDNPIVLELGCGKGEYAVGMAKKFADRNFIGVDIKGARMWTGAKQSVQEGIANVAFLRTSIELIASFFEAGEVSEIWITFPDPQMQKVNKRLTSTRFMQALSPDIERRRTRASENRQPVSLCLYRRHGASERLRHRGQHRRPLSQRTCRRYPRNPHVLRTPMACPRLDNKIHQLAS